MKYSSELSFNLTTVRLPLLTAQLSNMTMTAGQGSMLHLQSNMQHSPLGISIVNTHSGNVSFNNIAAKKSVVFNDAYGDDCQISPSLFLRCLHSP